MGADEARPNGLQRLTARIASSRPAVALLARVMHHVDGRLLRLNGGRWTLSGKLIGLPVLMLTTKGARSGQPRTTPVLGVPQGDGYILVASNWGQKRHPGWYYNLRREPACVATLHGEARRYRARQVRGEERERCWRRAAASYAGFEAYRRRAGREIAVFVLERGD
ncbi:MAG: nitroreductase family deazaflavin-dependent oxidoreductase [Chloroflexi bacterium]|jgi:deazaflavin-dependent oxidoreductase (nitroreductase family)|nr:nitroreductase family deazaflavin-dependent oxidoreductase [Chloroflexota bacterium]